MLETRGVKVLEGVKLNAHTSISTSACFSFQVSKEEVADLAKDYERQSSFLFTIISRKSHMTSAVSFINCFALVGMFEIVVFLYLSRTSSS